MKNMKKISLVLTLLLAITLASATEYAGIRCEQTSDCVQRYGPDWACVIGQGDAKICIEAEGRMMVPEFTGPAILGVIAIGSIAIYLLKKKNSSK
jgi:hypothetical protein